MPRPTKRRKGEPEVLVPSTLVGRRVKALRSERDMSQQGLAERLAHHRYTLHHTAIAKIELTPPLRRVTIDDLFALAYALDVSPIALLVAGAGEDRADRRH